MSDFSASSVDQHFNGAVDPIEEERSRLETDLAVAKARLLAAQHSAAQLDAQIKQAIRAELADSRDQLAALERDHAEQVRRVREHAEAEVERVLADAHRQVADIDASLAGAGAE